MATMWKTAAAEGLAICPLINPEALPLIDKMCQRYPDTTVVIDHFARARHGGPGQGTPVARPLPPCPASPHLRQDLSLLRLGREGRPPCLDLAPLIRRVRDAFGANRLMWASDAPFQVDPGHNYHDSIALIRDRLDFLTADDKVWMLRGTAEQVFFG